ncbi:MAG: DUF1365 domain-containing protein [Hyphomicrobiaceae bacterium]|nr:DUF1365 domain-containing protein [Hyphomicrobiaceae bacterium]
MSAVPAARFYVGDVVHKRLRPVLHALRYRVFALAIDVDRIGEAIGSCRLMSRGRFNVLSLVDSDYCSGAGGDIGTAIRRVLAEGGVDARGCRIELVTYPRLLGYAFNPLSVYIVHAPEGRVRAVAYEVSNTFGERATYVVEAGELMAGGVYAHGCDKAMVVSPFTPPRGRYGFRLMPGGDSITLAVSLRDGEGPLVKTHFRGVARSFDDRSIASLVVGVPFMTYKVIAGIHYEALRLWLKGVPLVTGSASAKFAVHSSRAPIRNEA